MIMKPWRKKTKADQEMDNEDTEMVEEERDVWLMPASSEEEYDNTS